MPDYDIIIVGGGLVGLSFALALKNTDFSLAIIEAMPEAKLQTVDNDARSIALSYRSRQIFSALDIWPQLASKSTAIDHIHISDRGHFGVTHIDAKQQGVDALGYSIQAQTIAQTLHHALADANNITYYRPATLQHIDTAQRQLRILQDDTVKTLQAGLIIAADGNQSSVRKQLGIATDRQDYNQSALVSNLTLDRPHQQIAYERFTRNGPIALLPIANNRMALVWTGTHAEVETLAALTEQQLLARLQTDFGYRAGKFIALSPWRCYPLNRIESKQQLRDGVLLLGNAAHSLHPVAAQGFNLGLRNVMRLTDNLQQYPHEFSTAINQYLQQCKSDQQQTMAFTHHLLKIFCNDYFPLTPLRGMALTVLDNLPSVKKIVARRAMGFR